jgi:hypothetical protein
MSVGGDLPRKFRPGGRKFRGSLKAEILAWGQKFRPPEISIQKIPARNSGPLQKVAPQLERKDLAKIRRARNSEIFGPLPESCTTSFCKGLSRIFEGQKLWNFRPLEIMEFLAPGNSAKPEFPAPLRNIAPQHFVKDLAEFRRARNSEIQEFPALGNFVEGRKFWP